MRRSTAGARSRAAGGAARGARDTLRRMSTPRICPPSRLATPALALITLALLAAATTASAVVSDAPEASASESTLIPSRHGVDAPASRLDRTREGERTAAGIAFWRGRHCPPTGCAGAPGSALANGAGFAASALAGVWIARRRGPTSG